MRFQEESDLSNIEDRRGMGGGGGLKLGLGGMLVLGVLSLIFRRNLFSLVDGSSGAGPSAGVQRDAATEARAKKIAVFAFNDAQRVWAQERARRGSPYRDAKMVLFWDETRSGCGAADAQTGPFYCPTDEKVYLDLAFFDELAARFGAPGEFAQAYVVAHEVGHHVQHLLGTDARMRSAQARNPAQKNELSVKLELQADCLAGVWAQELSEKDRARPPHASRAARPPVTSASETTSPSSGEQSRNAMGRAEV